MRFIERYEDVVKKYNDRHAVIDDRETLTYEDLDTRASRIYAYLKQIGYGKEDIVMIKLPRGVNTVAAILGVIKAGCAFVPLEDDYPSERSEYIRKDSSCKTVLDEHVLNEIYSTTEPLKGHEPTGLHDAACAVYTSGSTGNPKGVLHEYGNLDRIMLSMLKDEMWEKCGFVPSFYFIAAVFFLMMVITSADSMYIISKEILRDSNRLKDFILEKKLDWIYLPPSYIRLYDDPSPYLKRIFTGSEPANGLYYPNGSTKIINTYSMSEAGFNVLSTELDRAYDVAPVGKPTLDIPYYLYDDEGNEVRGAGQGELCFVNEYVRGYINLPEKTASAWKNGIYHTGDIARRDEDGRYYIIGRIDDMIKINGNRIEPAEIEARVQDLTGLRKVIAKGFSQGNRSFICVYYIREEAQKLGIMSNEKLTIDKERLKKHLPNYMIPAYYVALDAFPLNANGKIAKKELKCPEVSDYGKEYTAPDNEMEAYFCEEMAKLLKLERFSATGDFFEMGGSSVNAIVLAAECKKYPITVDMLYRYPSPRLLADNYSDVELPENLERLNEDAMHDKYRLIPQQLLNLVIKGIEGYAKVMEISSLFRIRDSVDIEKLSMDIDHVIEAHPALATRLSENSIYDIYQTYDRSMLVKTRIIEVTDEQFDSYLDEKYRDGKENIFNTTLYVSEILKYKEKYYYYLSLSHIIADGSSYKLLLDDIEKRYSDHAYEPKKDYWFLVLKRYWEKGTGKNEQSEGSEQNEYIKGLALSDKKEKWSLAIPADRKNIPVNGSVVHIPDAFLWKEEYNGIRFSAACLLAQCWSKKTDKAAILAATNNRNNDIKMDTFGMLATGIQIFLMVEKSDTASTILKKVEKETRNATIGKGIMQQIEADSDNTSYMMRFNYLYDINGTSELSDLFEEKLSIRGKKKNIRGAIATNIVYDEGNTNVGLRVVYSTDIYDRETIEKYVAYYRKAFEFLEKDLTLEEFMQKEGI